MKKILTLLAMVTALSACLPYNNFNSKAPGYYPNSYPQYQERTYQERPVYPGMLNQKMPNVSYEESAALDNIAMMQQQSIPVQQTTQQTVYQDLPQNPMYQQQMQQAKAYYNPAMTPQNPRGVIGVGQTLAQPVNAKKHNYKNSKSKLIMPSAWRMAHPSIGKGLELANQQERFNLNTALNKVSVKKPLEINLARKQVTLLSLTNSSTANSQGFMCKDAYILQVKGSNLNKMWGKFCRHPNWNEWVLTSW